jgi:ribosomal protein S16
MKKFIKTRVNWMDQQFRSPKTLISSLGYYKPDSKLQIASIDTKSKKGYTVVTVQVKDTDTASLILQVNGSGSYKAEVNLGQAVCKIPDTALVSEDDILNVVQVLAVDSKGSYLIHSKEEGNYYQAKSNYAVFYNNIGIHMDKMEDKETFAASKSKWNHNSLTLTVMIAVVLLITCLGVLVIIKYKFKP